MKKRPITELDDALRDFADGLGDSEKLLDDIGRIALTASRPHTPVSTGELLGSQSSRTERNRAVLVATAAHAGFVHEGTRFMPARPFFEEGIEDAQGEIISIVRDWAEDTFDAKVAR